MGGWRGWRLRVVEAFVIILAFTQTIYVVLLHSGFYSRGAYDDGAPGYGDAAYPGGVSRTEPVHKGVGGGGAMV